MNVLALEFSSERRSIAVLPANRASLPPTVSFTRANPRNLNAFHLIEAALAEAQLEREQIDCLAVGLGPGSYTGIRAAISIAQAWQLARGIKLFGIGSVECLAAQVQGEGLFGRVSFIIDAQRNEFYLATYDIQQSGARNVEPLRLATFAEALARSQAADVLAGPEANRWFPTARDLCPDAGALAMLAKGRTDSVKGEQLEPIYLRQTNFVKAPAPRGLPIPNKQA